MANIESKREILVRNIPKELYDFVIDEQSRSLKEGNRKSLGAIMLELAEKGMEAVKGGK
jgi:hypothetical protein